MIRTLFSPAASALIGLGRARMVVLAFGLLIALLFGPHIISLLPIRQAAITTPTLASPAHGILFRLAPRNSAWTLGQTPMFAVSFLNLSDHKVRIPRAPEQWEMELDGQRYCGRLKPPSGSSIFIPGARWIGMVAALDGNNWGTWEEGGHRFQRLNLSPGKHTLRLRTKAAFSEPSNLTNQPARLFSNSVEFEMFDSTGPMLTDELPGAVTRVLPEWVVAPPSINGDAQVQRQQPLDVDRTIRFPTNRSLGDLYLQDRANKAGAEYFLDRPRAKGWRYWGPGKGAVIVPVAQRIWLDLNIDDEYRDLTWLTTLRPNDLDTLTISRKGRQPCEADEIILAQLRGLTGLRVLSLLNLKITERALVFLKGLGLLQHLSIRQNPNARGLGEGALDDGCLKLLTELTSLSTLRLNGTQITDAGMAELARLSKLRELDLWSDKLEGPGLIHLQRLPELRYLCLWSPLTREDSFLHLAGLKSLQKLSLANLTLTNTWSNSHGGFPQLVELDLQNANLTPQGLSCLKSLRALKRLYLAASGSNNCRLGEAEANCLQALSSLESLHLWNLTLTDAGLASLCKLSPLKCLYLPTVMETAPNQDQDQYSDDGLDGLCRLPTLTELRVGSINVTDRGMISIGKLKNLKTLEVSPPQVSNAGLAPVAALTSLETLILETSKVTLSGLNQLNTLTNLRHLYLTYIQRDQVSLNLSRLTNLEEINVLQRELDDPKTWDAESWRDEDLAWLSSLKNVRRLWGIRGIGDRGMKHLANLHSMEWLNIGGLGVTDDGVANLSNMSALKHLTLRGKITDRGLRHLEGLKSLRYLNIGPEAVVSSTGLQRLQQAVPELEILYGQPLMGGGG